MSAISNTNIEFSRQLSIYAYFIKWNYLRENNPLHFLILRQQLIKLKHVNGKIYVDYKHIVVLFMYNAKLPIDIS